MRQIVLDTETTGLAVGHGHRIIEIGCIELVNRRLTGREFHRFLNPDRDIDDGAERVHGISRADLETAPHFAEIVALVQLDRIDEARQVLDRVFAIKPDLDMDFVRNTAATMYPALAERYVDGLRKAGLEA